MKAIDENTAEGRLSRRDIAHILAGLRSLQAQEQYGASNGDELNALVHGEGFEPFTSEEYDELCERLNFRDYATPYERGAVSLPLAAAQAAIALGLASGVASLMAWAQGLIGGVL
jgi:hypothetical protein